MLKDCVDCGDEFEAKEWYEVRCFPCWKEWKIERGEFVGSGRSVTTLRDNPDRGRRAGFKAQVDALTARVQQLEGELEKVAGNPQKSEAMLQDADNEVAGLKWELEQATAALAALAELKGHLPRLIQLCHPDRHGGSPASHRATQWLIQQREVRP